MNDTIKSVVSVASLPRPIHHLQIDLIEGGVILIVYAFFCGFLLCCHSIIFYFSGSFFSSLTPHVREYFPHIQGTCTFCSHHCERQHPPTRVIII